MKQGRRELVKTTSEIRLRYSQFSNTAGGLVILFNMHNNLRALDEKNSGNNYTGSYMGVTDLVLFHISLLSHWCPSSASYSEQRHCLCGWRSWCAHTATASLA